MEFLSGWKEIAEHLHLGVRTAQRWERLGLPVRRVSGSACSPVVAIPDELELWARTRDVQSDAAMLAPNKFLVSKLAELRQTHCRTRRKTHRLLAQINSLENQQKRLLDLIRTNLTQPDATQPGATQPCATDFGKPEEKLLAPKWSRTTSAKPS
jgi:hypothetical protein